MHLRTRFHSNVLLQYYRLWWPYLSKRNGKNNRIAERIALLDLASGIISIITPLTILNNNTVGPNPSWSYSIFNKYILSLRNWFLYPTESRYFSLKIIFVWHCWKLVVIVATDPSTLHPALWNLCSVYFNTAW